MKSLILPLLLLSAVCNANQMSDCKDLNVDLRSLTVPLEESSKSFLDDSVQLYKIDQIEPACCSVGVAVVINDAQSEVPGVSKCFAVMGYTGANIPNTQLVHSRSRGTLLIIPASTYNPEGDGTSLDTELVLKLDLPNSNVSVLE
ncbi:MAG: hypothetical protein KDD37_11290 [Bdellovibrionales bacterium]|nr:hypothetical protein [Bdellovibrionales bacterium]